MLLPEKKRNYKRAKEIALQLANPETVVGKFAYDIAIKATVRAFDESFENIKNELCKHAASRCEGCALGLKHFSDKTSNVFFYEAKRDARHPVVLECQASFVQCVLKSLTDGMEE